MSELTIKVARAEKNRIIQTGDKFLDVEFKVYAPATGKQKKPQLVETIKRGYPLETTPQEIDEDMRKILETYEKEKTQAVVQAEQEAAEKQADETLDNIKDKELKLQ